MHRYIWILINPRQLSWDGGSINLEQTSLVDHAVAWCHTFCVIDMGTYLLILEPRNFQFFWLQACNTIMCAAQQLQVQCPAASRRPAAGSTLAAQLTDSEIRWWPQLLPTRMQAPAVRSMPICFIISRTWWIWMHVYHVFGDGRIGRLGPIRPPPTSMFDGTASVNRSRGIFGMNAFPPSGTIEVVDGPVH
jgi:hypothetical protein